MLINNRSEIFSSATPILSQSLKQFSDLTSSFLKRTFADDQVRDPRETLGSVTDLKVL